MSRIMMEAEQPRERQGVAFGVSYMLLTLFVLVVTQPYLKFFGFGTDTDNQPLPVALALALFLMLLCVGRMPSRLVLTYAAYVVVFAVFNLFTGDFELYDYVRGMWGYFVLPVFMHVFYELFKGPKVKVLEVALKLSFFLWLGAGVAQVFQPDAMTFWRDKLITGGGRGAISFATEPAYFSLALLMMAMSLMLIDGKNRLYLYLTTLVSILVAKSMVGAVYSLAALYFFGSRKLIAAWVVLAVFAIAVFLVHTFIPDTRFATLLSDLLVSPMSLAEKDMSFGLRVSNMLVPLMAFRDDWGIPHGIFQWNAYHDEYMTNALQYSWGRFVSSFDNRKILSIHGQLIFEVGIFALIFYRWFWKVCRQHEKAWAIFAVLMVLFLNGLNLSSPFFAIFLATVAITRGRNTTRPIPAQNIP